jgi:hypothetical protein
MEDDCGVGEDPEGHNAKNLAGGRRGPSLKLIRKSVSLRKKFTYHLIRSHQHVRRNRQADLLRILEIDRKLDFFGCNGSAFTLTASSNATTGIDENAAFFIAHLLLDVITRTAFAKTIYLRQNGNQIPRGKKTQV